MLRALFFYLFINALVYILQSSVNMLLASVQKVGLNEDFMPFGRMKRETLLNARKILTDIG